MRLNTRTCSEIAFLNSLHNSYKGYLKDCLNDGKISKGLSFAKLNQSNELRSQIALELTLKTK